MIEWPEKESEPVHHWLRNLPSITLVRTSINTVIMCRRIELDCQELKQEIGLYHYDGRGWSRFYSLTSLGIVFSVFALSQRSRAAAKNLDQSKMPFLPKRRMSRGAGRMRLYVSPKIAIFRCLLARAIVRSDRSSSMRRGIDGESKCNTQ